MTRYGIHVYHSNGGDNHSYLVVNNGPHPGGKWHDMLMLGSADSELEEKLNEAIEGEVRPKREVYGGLLRIFSAHKLDSRPTSPSGNGSNN